MSDRTNVTELLAAALHQAAAVAHTRLEREVSVIDGTPPVAGAILRFDLSFGRGGRLSWYVSNDDATGLSDLLIGGAGDRGAVLTEMHLDALTVAFSDMLTRAVDTIAGSLDEQLAQGDLDLGMEQELPVADPAGCELVLALDIAGFGPITVVQHADPILAEFLERHAILQMQPVAAAEPELLAEQPAAEPASAPHADVTDNVVPLPHAGLGANTRGVAPRDPADLELLMNVPLPLTVELGTTNRTIRELVEFNVGSIIELSKLAGDPLDIKVNDRVIARGEVVVIDEEFGIRVTEIVSPEDRLRGLA